MRSLSSIDRGLLIGGLLFSSLVTAQSEQSLSSRAMDPSLTQAQRMQAIAALYPQQMQDGRIPPRRVCVWDLLGKRGPIYAAAQDQQAKLLDLGVQVEMDAYTNEGVLAEDLKAGQCDAALMTGLRARSFNRFTGTLDAIGAVPSPQHMNLLMKVLSHPSSAANMEENDFVVMGFAPMGSAYIFVNDRQISTLAKAAGKRIAVMDYDPVQAEMILGLGANPVPTSTVSAGSKFNNNSVDVLPAPLVAYNILELYRGMGEKGGIVDYPFSQLTLQLIGRRDKFPTEVAQLVREDFYRHFHEIEAQVEQQTGDIPQSVWIAITDQEKSEYQVLMQEARVALRDRGYYDGKMLTLQRKVRCKIEPANAECSAGIE